MRVLNPFISNMAVIKTISVSPDFEELRKQNGLSWSEAARVGMSLLLAERNVKDYDNNLNLYRKMQFFKEEYEKLSHRLQETEE